MSEELEQMRILNKKLQEQMDAKVAAFIQKTNRLEALHEKEMNAKFESGLVSKEKYEKYMDYLRTHKEEPVLVKPDIELRKKAYDSFLASTIQNRNRMLSVVPEAGVYSVLTLPVGADPSHSSNDPQSGTISDVTSNVARLKTVAITGEVYDYKTDTFTYGKVSSYASVIFWYAVPPFVLPQYGGVIRVTPVFNIFGSYWNTSNKIGDLDSLLADATITAGVINYGESPTIHLPDFPIKSPTSAPYSQAEIKDDYALPGFIGPAVEVDVKNEQLIVAVAVKLSCAVVSHNPVYANHAEIDFATESKGIKSRIELAELRIETLKANSPPPPLYMGSGDKPSPKGLADEIKWGTIDPKFLITTN